VEVAGHPILGDRIKGLRKGVEGEEESRGFILSLGFSGIS